tara:strand:- start:1521 stop:1697 length:177 start_codon:yes stop_codon:yes gene_type:complete
MNKTIEQFSIMGGEAHAKAAAAENYAKAEEYAAIAKTYAEAVAFETKADNGGGLDEHD